MINPEVAVQLHFSGRRISAVTVSNPAKTLEDHPKSDRRCDDRYVIHAVHHDKASENPSVAQKDWDEINVILAGDTILKIAMSKGDLGGQRLILREPGLTPHDPLELPDPLPHLHHRLNYINAEVRVGFSNGNISHVVIPRRLSSGIQIRSRGQSDILFRDLRQRPTTSFGPLAIPSQISRS
ncbi:hypothetical protein NOF04DRAFT_1273018 [Fusarium oxysporum II5]|uniref:Uncharacterized protein n=1 Tax=Fusarium oxysporum f. sp. cubense TaxID=61366 RepID=A0A5C6T9Y2_FUSOC|nr:hypothetical protein NOF04DRAFT_1273018 [Fusarium oxysporum II5]TXC07805.1 hypothetical protein FocTR4_00003939 [Fusarium oxysporum f. sp. cubense]